MDCTQSCSYRCTLDCPQSLICTFSNILSSILHTYSMYHMYGLFLHFCLHCAIFLYSNILQLMTWQSLVLDSNHIMLSTVELITTVEISHTGKK